MQSFITGVLGIIMIGGAVFGSFGLGLATEKMFRGDCLREVTSKQKGEIVFFFWGFTTSACAILAIVLLLVR